jgi:hypothetical protein
MNRSIILLLVLIILFNSWLNSSSFGTSMKEGFTKKIRQNIRPHLRSVHSTKDSFVNKGDNYLTKIQRYL